MLITDDLTELDVARGLLESAGIATSTSGAEFARMLGTNLLSPLLGKRATGVRLLVAQRDREAAEELLASVSDSAAAGYTEEELAGDDE